MLMRGAGTADEGCRGRAGDESNDWHGWIEAVCMKPTFSRESNAVDIMDGQ
jgi:hypothetical protein